jgi:hypothetical protein
MDILQIQWFCSFCLKSQQMKCVIRHNFFDYVAQKNTHDKKRLFMYNKDHNTTNMTRHVISKHS